MIPVHLLLAFNVIQSLSTYHRPLWFLLGFLFLSQKKNRNLTNSSNKSRIIHLNWSLEFGFNHKNLFPHISGISERYIGSIVHMGSYYPCKEKICLESPEAYYKDGTKESRGWSLKSPPPPDCVISGSLAGCRNSASSLCVGSANSPLLICVILGVELYCFPDSWTISSQSVCWGTARCTKIGSLQPKSMVCVSTTALWPLLGSQLQHGRSKVAPDGGSRSMWSWRFSYGSTHQKVTSEPASSCLDL